MSGTTNVLRHVCVACCAALAALQEPALAGSDQLPAKERSALQEARPIVLGSSPSCAPRVCEPVSGGFRLGSDSIEVVVRNGAVVWILNRITGEIHAQGESGDVFMPGGVFSPEGSSAEFRNLHGPWSSHVIQENGRIHAVDAVVRRAGTWSTVSYETIPGGIRCRWVGLQSNRGSFPRDQVVVDAVVDPATGFISLSAHATSGGSDVAGVMVPVVNLHTAHSIYAPSFGGRVYTPTDLLAGGLRTLCSAPYLEAPVLVAETALGCIGLWMQDSAFRPYCAFLGRGPDGVSMGLEAVELMPFQGKRVSRKAVWMLGAFAGTWPMAMRPYQQWYAGSFANEVMRRRGTVWPDDISVIVDAVENPVESLTRLGALIKPSQVLIHEWQPRRLGFNDGLPDWTPKPQFLDRVKLADDLGFKSMGYVNSYCVSYQSTAFIRDRVADFGLTRRIPSLSAYGLTPQTFATAEPGEVLYLDPISPRWRRYHTDQMIRWQLDTHADANYVDTAGTAGDFGNGEIEGVAGAQGGTEQFRELLLRNPVPMATEFAPDNIAFASVWALRFSQAWGDAEVRRLWESRHRPITPLLFSGAGRAWVPTVAAETEALKWTVVACSDALGGIAQLSATPAMLEARAGLARHMLDRAQLFSRLSLRPTFDDWPLDPTVVAQYRSRDGALYRYRVDDGLQELVDSASRPLYQRLTTQTSIESSLRVYGWPAWSGSKTIGLRSTSHYALGKPGSCRTAVQIDRCPDGLAIARYVEGRDYALVNFIAEGGGRLGLEETLGLIAHVDFTDVIAFTEGGGLFRKGAPLRAGERLELSAESLRVLLLVRSMPVAPRSGPLVNLIAQGGIFVTEGSGIERGGRSASAQASELKPPGFAAPVKFWLAGQGGDSACVYERLVLVPDQTAALEVMFRNSQRLYGDGASVHLIINGRRIQSIDLGPKPSEQVGASWDIDVQQVRIPLGAYRGLPTVVGVSVTNNGTDNADEIWIAEPKLVRDPSQGVSRRAIELPR